MFQGHWRGPLVWAVPQLFLADQMNVTLEVLEASLRSRKVQETLHISLVLCFKVA